LAQLDTKYQKVALKDQYFCNLLSDSSSFTDEMRAPPQRGAVQSSVQQLFYALIFYTFRDIGLAGGRQ
jgi:hypothetical protein